MALVDAKPLGARLMLRAPAAPDRVGSLWLPPAAEKSYTLQQGEIVARGAAVRDWRLQPGAHVVCRKFGGVPLDASSATWIVSEEDVLAIFA